MSRHGYYDAYDEYDDDRYDWRRRRGLLRADPHSGWGIASCIVALLVGLSDAAVIGVGVAVELSKQGGMSEEDPVAMLVGCVVLLGLAVNVGGLVMAVVGLAADDRRKLFAYLGLALNGGALIFIGLLILLGLMAA